MTFGGGLGCRGVLLPAISRSAAVVLSGADWLLRLLVKSASVGGAHIVVGRCQAAAVVVGRRQAGVGMGSCSWGHLAAPKAGVGVGGFPCGRRTAAQAAGCALRLAAVGVVAEPCIAVSSGDGLRLCMLLRHLVIRIHAGSGRHCWPSLVDRGELGTVL